MTLDRVAAHEAGHGVAAALLDVAFSHLSASEGGGHARFDSAASAADVGDWCLCSLAGAAAERAVFGVASLDSEADAGAALDALAALGVADPLAALPGAVARLADVFRQTDLRRVIDAVAGDLVRHDGWLPAAAVRGRVWAVPQTELASVRRRLRRIVTGRIVKNFTKGV